MTSPPTVLERLGVRFGEDPVLTGVDLRVGPGEVVGLMGPNGSGKTTLLRILATLVRPTRGEGRVLGARLGTEEVLAVRPRIGLIGHVPALYPELTLEENTALVASLAGRPPERVPAVLVTVGLGGAAGRRADRCSYGMQRRAEFARVLLVEPDLLLMDEAHAGLDRESLVLVEHLLEGVRARGGGAVVVSHDPARVIPNADRVVELRNGSLMAVDHDPHGGRPPAGRGGSGGSDPLTDSPREEQR